MSRQILLSIAISLTCFLSAFAQGSIEGTVTDSRTGEELPGVNILIVELGTGTATDLDGNYSITGLEEGNYTFRVSYIGYATLERQIEITSGENSGDFELQPDVGMLDEVIVSGVADATSKKKMTVSVTRVDASRLNQVPATSVSGSLAGKVSGVSVKTTTGTPGGSADLLLRADNNLSVGSDPLIIIDGIIMEGSMGDINVDDVQSIEVVKGAAASSLYGSRAGNGVIVVTSKRGDLLEKGSVDVTVRNEVGFQDLERKLDLAMHHHYELAPDWQDFPNYTKYAGVTYPESYYGGFHPEITGSRQGKADQYMDNPYAIQKDPQDQFFQRGMNLTNFISIGTRVDNMNVYGSFENHTQEGIIPNTDGYARRNFRVNADYDLADWLKVSASNLIINRTSNFPGGGGGIFFNIVLAEPDNSLYLENPDGQPYYYRHNHWSNEANPLYTTYKNERDENRRRYLGNFNVKANPLDWLEYKGSYSMETNNYRYTNYYPFDYYTLDGDSYWGIGYSEGSLYKFSSERYTQQIQHQLITRQQFGKLYTRIALSYLWEDDQYESFDASGSRFRIRNLPRFNAMNPDDIDASSFIRDIRAENYFAIITLDWEDKYLFDTMIRRDGSSLFGPDARWNTYYRVSAAYRITQDIDIPNVNELKIRAARGTAGIRPDFSWQYETFSVSGGNTSKSSLGNRNLKPSHTQETEVALETTVFDRLNFEAIYAESITKDQFLEVPLLPVAGYNSQWRNAGEISSNTLEFNLNGDILNQRELYWNFGITWQTSKQEITRLDVPPFQAGPDGLFYMREGEVYGAIYGFTFVRSLDDMANQLPSGTSINDYTVNSDGFVIEAGMEGTPDEVPIRLLDENGDDAFVKIGNGRPDWTAGITNTFRYKGFSAYVLLDIKHGGDIYNRKSQWLTRDRRHGMMDQAGKPQDEKKAIGYYLGLYDVNSNNSFWVEDAGYVKLREVSLSYQFGAEQLGVFGGALKGATVSAIGRNLLTFTSYSGYDPETGSIRTPFDSTARYPNFRNYALSVSLKF